MSKIQWTDKTSNPIYLIRQDESNGGHWCQKISEGCANCYAEAINNSSRFSFSSHLPYTGNKPDNLFLDKSILIKWVKARSHKLIFPFSMTDWCGDWVSETWSMNILDSMAASKLTFQTLTKRADRLKMVCDRWLETRKLDKIPPNIWLGVSTEKYKHFKERVPFLTSIPCDVRWISIEPMLYKFPDMSDKLTGIDWVVVGGESTDGKKKARKCYLEWIEAIINDCIKADVPVFVKQLGSNAVYCDNWGNSYQFKTKDKKGGDVKEFPPCLQIRQFPKVPQFEEAPR